MTSSRPPSDGEVLFYFILFYFYDFSGHPKKEPFLGQPKMTKVKGRQLMGELLLGTQKGREAEKKRGTSCLVQKRQLRREETQLYEKVGQLSENVAVTESFCSFWGVRTDDR